MPDDTLSLHALGTTISMYVHGPPVEENIKLRKQFKRTILEFEKRFSRFLPNSELTKINQGSGRYIGVSDEFLGLLQKSIDVSKRTDGIFNPLILPNLQRSGYLRSFVEKYSNDPVPDYTARALGKVQEIEIEDNRVRIPTSSALDFGGCGKGYLGDLLANILDKRSDVEGYWLSLGGDVVASGVHPNGSLIQIGARNPVSNRVTGIITVKKGERTAVATSTTLFRRGVVNGQAWHHIIDPRTGSPSNSDIHSATVVSNLLFEADVHASNCIIIGSQKVKSYISAQGISDTLVYTSGSHNIIGERIAEN